jgi:hypothetical protein
MGDVSVVGALAGTIVSATATVCPHPPASPPFIVADSSAPAGPAAGAVGSLNAATIVGAPVGFAAGQPPAGLLFLTAGTSALAGPAAGATGPLDAAATVGTPASTVTGTTGLWATATIAGAPAWPPFDPSMGRAPYWSMLHAFFAAPQYGFLVQSTCPSSFHPSMGGAPYWSTPHAFFVVPQCCFLMQQVGPFYLNDVMLAPDLVQSLLSVCRFTTDNSCSVEFDPFGLSVKDIATMRVLARYDSTSLLYTLSLPTSSTPTSRDVPYAL